MFQTLNSNDGKLFCRLFREQVALIMSTIFVCRICLDSNNKRDLCVPCRCSGTSLFVHRQCLRKWQDISTNPDSKTKCPTCTFVYDDADAGKQQSDVDRLRILNTLVALVAICLSFMFVFVSEYNFRTNKLN